ncbi:MAG TPA: thioredoxin [Candidatus Aminicenantes bacterium]|nr:thioredoxin [Candidatus Aminicenantes bacterium]
MSDEIIHSSDAAFENDVLKSELPVLVDFWATWCGPCRMIAPLIDELALTYKGRLRVVKVNVDENREVPARYGIMGIPTLLLFKGGEMMESIVGVVPRNRLVDAVSKYL